MREMNEIVSFNDAVLHNDITTMLRELSFIPNYSGFNYIREAVKMVVCFGDDIPGISNSSFQMHSGTSPDATKNDMRKTTNRKWR